MTSTFDSFDITTRRTPAQVIKLVINSGRYSPHVSYMCQHLSAMHNRCEINCYEFSETKNSINEFLIGWNTMRGYLTAVHNIQVSRAPQIALAIYSDWDNRDTILAQAIKDYGIDHTAYDDMEF